MTSRQDIDMVPPIDIRPEHWAIVCEVLQKHVPRYEVWAFGSRAKWRAKPSSDLDLAVITDRPLPLVVSAALAEDFSECDLPWKVDGWIGRPLATVQIRPFARAAE